MVLRAVKLLLIVVALGAAEKLDLPVTTCKRGSSDYRPCLINAIQKEWPRFIKDLPAEFEFMLDPVNVTNQKVEFGSGELRGKVFCPTFILSGISTGRVKNARTHFEDEGFQVTIDMRFSQITAKGECEAVGTLFGFSLSGKGKLNATFTGIKVTCDMSGPVKNDTWTVEQNRIIPMVNGMRVHIDRFVHGSPELDRLAEDFVNNNWPSLFRLIASGMAEQWEMFAINRINSLFSKLSFSKIFP